MISRKYTDFLVIGTGITGLFVSWKLSELGNVVLITKKSDYESNTNYAQGGIASVFSEDDSPEEHIEDTLRAGAGLCDRESVRVLVQEGPNLVQELLNLGVPFDKDDSGKLNLTREGGHSKKRIVHAQDKTGKEIERTLLSFVKSLKNIEILEEHALVDLITRHHLPNRPKSPLECYGAYVLNKETSEIIPILAKNTVLASGGAGQIYLHTTNPSVATGDGLAAAYRAGAIVKNMEFYQFHPTALYEEGVQESRFLISEAVRGEGGILKDIQGKPFMKNYHELAELAPRDIVARAIDNEIKKSGLNHVYLDISHKSKDEIIKKFPSIFDYCMKRGLDISKNPIPVVPAAHYMCGGIQTDLWGATNINHLYAAGEIACTGVHGGNRLASNSLLECLVFGNRISQKIKKEGIPKEFLEHKEVPDWNKEGTKNPEEWVLVSHDLQEIKTIMNDYVGIVRSDLRLIRAKRRMDLILSEIIDYYNRTTVNTAMLELRNIAQVAMLVVESALLRKESRGLHFSTDYPEDRRPSRQDTYLQNI